jgi:hypothetical protein
MYDTSFRAVISPTPGIMPRAILCTRDTDDIWYTLLARQYKVKKNKDQHEEETVFNYEKQ